MSKIIPTNFKLIDVPLPPMLLDMIGVKGNSRFVSLFYQGSKATWSDGRSCATFPFFTVWQPYIEHLAIAIDLFNCDLGSDDTIATDALMSDRATKKVYVAPIDEATEFLNAQHPPQQPLTPQQWEEIKAQAQSMRSISQLQELGMFELFIPPTPERQEKAAELVQWLDTYTNEDLIRRYQESAASGNWKADWALEVFKGRYQLNN